MRVGNLQSAAGRIQEALDDLNLAWEATKEHWADQQAVAFEERYLREIREVVMATFPAINQCSQTFGAAARDCSE